MKKIVSVMLGLVMGSAAMANEINNKFYAGLTTGATGLFYKKDARPTFGKSKVAPNVGVVLGKGFGVWGTEANGMLLASRKVSTSNKRINNWMFGANAYYNFFNNQSITCKVLAGAYGIVSTATTTVVGSNNVTVHEKIRFAPQVGLGATYALNHDVALTATVNYVKPINHSRLSNVVYGTIGVNCYFA